MKEWYFMYEFLVGSVDSAIIDMKSSHVYSLVGTYIDSTTSASILVYTICTQDPPGFTQGRYPDLLISHATAQDA